MLDGGHHPLEQGQELFVHRRSLQLRVQMVQGTAGLGQTAGIRVMKSPPYDALETLQQSAMVFHSSCPSKESVVGDVVEKVPRWLPPLGLSRFE